MTPLATRVTDQMGVAPMRRTILDEANLLKRWDGIHCFDVTAVALHADQLSEFGLSLRSRSPDLISLPTERTWIEEDCRKFPEYPPAIEQIGYLLDRDGTDPASGRIRIIQVFGLATHIVTTPFAVMLAAGSCDTFYTIEHLRARLTDAEFEREQRQSQFIAQCLALINMPRTFGNRSYLTNAALQRRVMARKPITGSYPLKAWTDILLQIRLPSENDARATILSGKKALHHIRRHKRTFRDGSHTWVREHWRGDGSLGLKQQRYILKPPPEGEPLR